MPIVALCTCGKRIGVGDALAGRTISCPKCGEQVLVPLASAPAGGAARKKKDATPAVSVNPLLLLGGTVGLILLVIVLALYFGPWTVGKQWAAMSGKANTDVTDVVGFAIKAYESQHGLYNAGVSHMEPMTSGDATFFAPYMAFNMPRRISFFGSTNQGIYHGTYDTTTHEITADIETGGYTVGGLVSMKKATGSFQMTGREKDGNVTAECDGTPLTIFVPKIEKD